MQCRVSIVLTCEELTCIVSTSLECHPVLLCKASKCRTLIT